MKKLVAIVVVLILVACSSKMSGQTTTICIDVPRVFVEDDTIVIIEGYDEKIHLWTERTTLTREQLNDYVLEGMNLTDDEIVEMFEFLNTLEADGFELRLLSLSDREAMIEYVYDYTIISTEELSDIWDVDDFEREITLSAAVRGLEAQNAVCNTE
jgi:hypothetical protein